MEDSEIVFNHMVRIMTDLMDRKLSVSQVSEILFACMGSLGLQYMVDPKDFESSMSILAKNYAEQYKEIQEKK